MEQEKVKLMVKEASDLRKLRGGVGRLDVHLQSEIIIETYLLLWTD